MTQNIEYEIKRKKRFLNRYKKNNARIARLEEKLLSLEERIQKIRTSNLSGMPRGGIPVTLDDLLYDKDILKDRIKKLRSKRKDLKKSILDEIDQLEDVRYTEILEMFFIDGLSFGEIGEELGYTERHVTRLYSDGVEQLVYISNESIT